MGPSRRISWRSSGSNVPALAAASALDMARLARWLRRAPAGGTHHQDAGEDHGQGINDAGGEWPDRKQVCGVGFAKQLAEGARQTVAGKKGAGDEPRLLQGLAPVGQPEQHAEQERALEQGLIELARVAWPWAGAGKNHGPRQIAGAAPQFSIDEI